MTQIQDMYQQVIMDHNRHPRNRGTLTGATHHGEGYNHLCGDHYQVDVAVAGGRIEEIRFEGDGCAISTASASLMTEALRGATVDEARDIWRRFHAMITAESGEPLDESLGKLRALAGVRAFPMRVKCASLAWHALLSAINADPEGDHDDG